MIVAILFYAAASAALVALEPRLARAAAGDASASWLNEHLYTPLLRTLVLTGFILMAYPQLLGLDPAPPLAALLRDGHADMLITTMFVASLALPLVPVIAAVPGAVLALQGILGCCMLSSWVAEALGIAELRYWMGWPIALEIAAILVAGRLAARALLHWWPRRAEPTTAAMIGEATRLASELPAIALYGWALGRQLQGIG